MSFQYEVVPSLEDLKAYFDSNRLTFNNRIAKYSRWLDYFKGTVVEADSVDPTAELSNVWNPSDINLVYNAIDSLTRILATMRVNDTKPSDFVNLLRPEMKRVGITALTNMRYNTENYTNHQWGTKLVKSGKISDLGWAGKIKQFTEKLIQILEKVSADDKKTSDSLNHNALSQGKLVGREGRDAMRAFKQIRQVADIRFKMIDDCVKQMVKLNKVKHTS